MAFRGVDGPPKQGTLTIQGVPKKMPLSVVLITMGESNEQQKIYNRLEKAEVLSFLQKVVDFLSLIWFARGNDKITNFYFLSKHPYLDRVWLKNVITR